MHSDDGMPDVLRRFMFVEQLQCLSMVCLAQGYHQSFIFCFCAKGPCRCKVVVLFMNGPKSIILYTHIDEPDISVVTCHTPLTQLGIHMYNICAMPRRE